jgi:peptidoglycan/LPS O-acetylase OafA/YrhL
MGAIGALSQTSALLTRHWWPLTVLGCTMSRRVRRAVAVAAVAGITLEYCSGPADTDPLRYGIARRLDDLAHGAGAWWPAVKGRSTRALKPHVLRTGASLDERAVTPADPT